MLPIDKVVFFGGIALGCALSMLGNISVGYYFKMLENKNMTRVDYVIYYITLIGFFILFSLSVIKFFFVQ